MQQGPVLVPEECCEELRAWGPDGALRTDPQGPALRGHHPSQGEVQRVRVRPPLVEFPAQACRQDQASERECRPSLEEVRSGYPAAALDPDGP